MIKLKEWDKFFLVVCFAESVGVGDSLWGWEKYWKCWVSSHCVLNWHCHLLKRFSFFFSFLIYFFFFFVSWFWASKLCFYGCLLLLIFLSSCLFLFPFPFQFYCFRSHSVFSSPSFSFLPLSLSLSFPLRISLLLALFVSSHPTLPPHVSLLFSLPLHLFPPTSPIEGGKNNFK